MIMVLANMTTQVITSVHNNIFVITDDNYTTIHDVFNETLQYT